MKARLEALAKEGDPKVRNLKACTTSIVILAQAQDKKTQGTQCESHSGDEGIHGTIPKIFKSVIGSKCRLT